MRAAIYSLIRGLFCCPLNKHRWEKVGTREDFAKYTKVTAYGCKDCSAIYTKTELLRAGNHARRN